MSPELILVPRAFIILVSVGDRFPTLTKTIDALVTRMESRAQRNDKRIHGYVRMKQQNFIFYFIILPHRWNYCGGEISEKPSLWGIEISPNFWLKQMKIAGIIPSVHENCWGTSKRFEELQEIIEMNNKYLLALIESWNNWESLKTVRVKVFCSISTSTLLFYYEFWPTFQYFEPILEFNFCLSHEFYTSETLFINLIHPSKTRASTYLIGLLYIVVTICLLIG